MMSWQDFDVHPLDRNCVGFSRFACRVVWVECAVCESVQPDVMTNVRTSFCLTLKGPAEVYASAVVTVTHDTSVQVNMSHP